MTAASACLAEHPPALLRLFDAGFTGRYGQTTGSDMDPESRMRRRLVGPIRTGFQDRRIGPVSGSGEILFYEGRDLNPPPGIGMWLAVMAFITFQGLLIFALIRLRRPNPSSSLPGHVITGESH